MELDIEDSDHFTSSQEESENESKASNTDNADERPLPRRKKVKEDSESDASEPTQAAGERPQDTLKRDHECRPCYVTSNGHIILEVFDHLLL
jgi:hypothetical protein